MAKTWTSYKMRWSDIDMTDYLELHERIRVHERKQEEAYAKGIFSCKSVEDKETQMEDYSYDMKDYRYDMKEYVAGEDIGNYRSMTIREGKLYEHNYKEGYNIGFPEVDIKKGTTLKRRLTGNSSFDPVQKPIAPEARPEARSAEESLSEQERLDFFQAVKGKKLTYTSPMYDWDGSYFITRAQGVGYSSISILEGTQFDKNSKPYEKSWYIALGWSKDSSEGVWSFVNDADQKHHENIKRHLIGARLEDKRWTYAQMLERRKQTPEGFAIDFTYPEPELKGVQVSIVDYGNDEACEWVHHAWDTTTDISISPQGAIPVCTCEIRTIMMSGCGCGAFAAEQAAKLTGGNV